MRRQREKFPWDLHWENKTCKLKRSIGHFEMLGTGLLILRWIELWDCFEGLRGVVALMIDGERTWRSLEIPQEPEVREDQLKWDLKYLETFWRLILICICGSKKITFFDGWRLHLRPFDDWRLAPLRTSILGDEFWSSLPCNIVMTRRGPQNTPIIQFGPLENLWGGGGGRSTKKKKSAREN